MEVESISDLLALMGEAVAWGALFCGVYKLYDKLLAKAGWEED